MGFFAVVKPLHSADLNDPLPQEFAVEKLDVNVWCLPRFFGRFLIFCDIGVRLRADTAVTALSIGIPFQTTSGALSDLYGPLGSPETAALVFGEPVVGENNAALDRDSDFATRQRISIEGSRLLRSLSSSAFSLWHVAFDHSQQPGSTHYYRMRFRVKDFGRTWTWRRTYFRRVGALVDLHFCDPRDAALVPQGTRYETEERLIAPIGQLNAFVIVLASMRMRKTSPELRYLRLLEGRRWERYLGRATDLRRRQKFLVHYWRAQSVRVGDEFRAFLELGRNTESLGWPAMVTVAALAAFGVVLVDSRIRVHESPLGRLVRAVAPPLEHFFFSFTGGGLTLVALLTIFVLFSETFEFAAPIRRWVLRRVRQVEDAVYKHRADLGP